MGRQRRPNNGESNQARQDRHERAIQLLMKVKG